jgi:hypothetical protein
VCVCVCVCVCVKSRCHATSLFICVTILLGHLHYKQLAHTGCMLNVEGLRTACNISSTHSSEFISNAFASAPSLWRCWCELIFRMNQIKRNVVKSFLNSGSDSNYLRIVIRGWTLFRTTTIHRNKFWRPFFHYGHCYLALDPNKRLCTNNKQCG